MSVIYNYVILWFHLIIFSSQDDTHKYYNSTILTKPTEAMKYWVDIDKMPNVTLHPMLPKSDDPPAPVNLDGEFPVYGFPFPIKNVTISTEGFLLLYNIVDSYGWSYIAPLMAAFDPRFNTTKVKYAKNSTMFVVQWENLAITKHPQKFFTTQVSIFPTGDIVFVYKNIPISFNDFLGTDDFRIGLSYSFQIEKNVVFDKDNTIHYNRFEEDGKGNIRNNTAIYFTALPTCHTLKDCKSCWVGFSGLDCRWCESTGRCFDGLHRPKGEWLAKNCDTEAKKNNCLVSTNSSTVIRNATSTISPYPGNLNWVVQLGIWIKEMILAL
ncbi:plexin domain-containing protein 1-like [Tetranychus urticae]|uniref:PSI domain-containing protein n=1 Tax=Tetranychus urticae TaxID=32264 RepID=T1L0L1_TETUR|nr:plexin domain-containing protein 1-like [Tetranychus urticae]